MVEVTLSSKNQIVILKEAREALGVKPWDKLIVTVHDGRMMVMERPVMYHLAIEGLVSRGYYGPDYLKKERASWKRKRS